VVADGLEVQNLSHIGVSPREGVSGNHEEFNHQSTTLSVNITDPDGVGVIEGLRKTSPTEVAGHAENDPTLGSWANHCGTVYVRRSRVDNEGGDGCTYLSRTAGGWRFTDCTFVQNYASTLRLGGAQSWARRCTIVLDGKNDTTNNILDALASYQPGQNGIVWESSSAQDPQNAADRPGGLIDGCEIIMRSVNGSRGGIVVDGSSGGVVVRNTRVENHTDQPSIAVERPGSSFMNDHRTPDGPHPVYLRAVELVGSGRGPAVEIDGRRVVGNGVRVEMANAGDMAKVERASGGRPGFADRLLSLQGGVPDPASAIGSSGEIGGGIGGAAQTALAAGGAAVLLLGGLLVLPFLALFSYLLN
jgi:hypothetical protein